MPTTGTPTIPRSVGVYLKVPKERIGVKAQLLRSALLSAIDDCRAECDAANTCLDSTGKSWQRQQTVPITAIVCIAMQKAKTVRIGWSFYERTGDATGTPTSSAPTPPPTTTEPTASPITAKPTTSIPTTKMPTSNSPTVSPTGLPTAVEPTSSAPTINPTKLPTTATPALRPQMQRRKRPQMR